MLEPKAKTEAAVAAAFKPGLWTKEINVRNFIQQNYDALLRRRELPRRADRSGRSAIWKKLTDLFVEERKKGVLDVSQIPSSITAHDAGYIDKENEVIVGLQTDAPLKRAIMPNGGLKMVTNGLEAYGYKPDPKVVEIFTKYRKTHNDGVFDAYTARRPPLPQLARPDRPSRCLWPRPDHRRLSPRRALRRRPADRAQEGRESSRSTTQWSTDEIIRDREELSEQIRALGELKEMAAKYGFDISGPATSAKEAVQWLYFGYLAGSEGTEWRGDVAGPRFDLPRHLFRARPRKRACSPRSRRRRSSTISSSSCASSVSCARPNMTICSPATRPG